MNNRTRRLAKWLPVVVTALIAVSWLITQSSKAVGAENPAKLPTEAVNEDSSDKEDSIEDDDYQPKSKAQLRRELSSMQYKVTQNEATEPAFRNRYWDNKRKGVYQCVVCELPLFTSETKFKSGTGWPSFYAPLKAQHIGTRKDWRLFYTRIEVHCRRCKAHLGHVFDDGPRPTGKRYCLNSAALKFTEASANQDQ